MQNAPRQAICTTVFHESSFAIQSQSSIIEAPVISDYSHEDFMNLHKCVNRNGPVVCLKIVFYVRNNIQWSGKKDILHCRKCIYYLNEISRQTISGLKIVITTITIWPSGNTNSCIIPSVLA